MAQIRKIDALNLIQKKTDTWIYHLKRKNQEKNCLKGVNFQGKTLLLIIFFFSS